MTTLCSDIATQVGSLFRCTDSGEYVRIRTPFLYPDGDVIDLFAKNGNGSSFTLTDLGETLGWLRMQTLANRRSPKQNKLIEDVALRMESRSTAGCSRHGFGLPRSSERH